MHHLGARSNLVVSASETNTLASRSGSNHDQPLCPKPRRLGTGIPDFLKPQRCSKHSQLNTDGRKDILSIISDKNADGRESQSRCNGCTPSCYSGSPPGRTENPLVQDVQFIHQMELVSPFTRTKLSDKFGFTSASPI